jgi:hypothetical protein
LESSCPDLIRGHPRLHVLAPSQEDWMRGSSPGTGVRQGRVQQPQFCRNRVIFGNRVDHSSRGHVQARQPDAAPVLPDNPPQITGGTGGIAGDVLAVDSLQISAETAKRAN